MTRGFLYAAGRSSANLAKTSFPTKIPLRGLLWLQGDLIPEMREALDVVMGCPVDIPGIEVVLSEIGGGATSLHEVVGDQQDRMPDRHDGSLAPAAFRQPLKLGVQVGLAGPRGGPGDLPQCRTEPP